MVGKTATAKKLGAEKDISVWEVERRLDAKLFLDEIPKWEPSGPQHPFLYQKMFAHVKAIDLKDYHHGICQHHWQPSPERALWAEVSAMGLLTPQTTHKEILA